MSTLADCEHCGTEAPLEHREDQLLCLSCLKAHAPYLPHERKMCRTPGCPAYMRTPYKLSQESLRKAEREDAIALSKLQEVESELRQLEAAVEENDPKRLPLDESKLCVWQYSEKYKQERNLSYDTCPRAAEPDKEYCLSHQRMIDQRGLVNHNAKSNGAGAKNVDKTKKAWQEFGRKKEGLSPILAMMALIYEAAGNVEYYRDRINEEERLVIAGKKEKEEITGLVRLYNEERDRLEGFLKDAFRIGLEQKQLKLHQMQAMAMVTIFKRLVHSLNLTNEQRQLAFTEISSGLRTYALEAGAQQWRGPFIEARQTV